MNAVVARNGIPGRDSNLLPLVLEVQRLDGKANQLAKSTLSVSQDAIDLPTDVAVMLWRSPLPMSLVTSSRPHGQSDRVTAMSENRRK